VKEYIGFSSTAILLQLLIAIKDFTANKPAKHQSAITEIIFT
jgi:hypothetical protein